MKKIVSLVLTVLFAFHLLAQNTPSFTENKGQWLDKVLYQAALPNGTLFIEKDCFTFDFFKPEANNAHAGFSLHHTENQTNTAIQHHSYKVNFLNANTKNTWHSAQALQSYTNYFLSKDKTRWARRLKSFRQLELADIYEQIDLKITFKNQNFVYDFIVKPGGNAKNIQLKYEGVENLNIKNGNLIVRTSVNKIVELRPYAYQVFEGDTLEVACRYKLQNNILTFEVPEVLDNQRDLIIDPELVFSTYSGSEADNWGFTATYDFNGNVYSAGIVHGVGYPSTIGAYQTEYAGTWDVGIIKYNASGTERLYATYLGGTGSEMPHSLVVNEDNDLLIFGTTGSADFPVSENAYNQHFSGGSALNYMGVNFENGTDIYVTKLSADGSNLLASSYIGGSENDGMNFRSGYNVMHGNDSLYYNYGDGARGEIITDNRGNIYVGTCSFSDDFPLVNAFQPQRNARQEGVVLKLDYDLSNIIWSSYLGGSMDDAIFSIDVDSEYNLYVSGGTNSVDFPVTEAAFQPNYAGGTVDAFVSLISEAGEFIYSTYYGSDSYDQSYFVRTDKNDHAYLFGQTKASGSTLIFNATYNRPNSGQFIAKFSKELDNLLWSTVFGTGSGKPNISPTAFAVDICGRIYLSGSGREWIEYVGWTPDPDNAGVDVYDFGWDNIEGTKGMDITNDAFQTETDGMDFYVMVMAQDASDLEYATFLGEIHYGGCTRDSEGVHCGCYRSGRDHVDGGTSRFDKKGNIYQSVCASCGGCQHFPTTPEGVWSAENGSTNCNNATFRFKLLNDFVLADFRVPEIGCAPQEIFFENTSIGSSFTWDFGDGTISTEENPQHIYTESGIYQVRLIAYEPNSCNVLDTLVKQITVLSNSVQQLDARDICPHEQQQIGIVPNGSANISYHWLPETGLSNPNVSNPFASPENTTHYKLIVSNGTCADTLLQTVRVHAIGLSEIHQDVSCFGMNDGKIELSINTQEEIRYSLNGVGEQLESFFENLGQGIYQIVARNANNCTESVEIEISEPTELRLEDIDIQDISCFGDETGRIQIRATGAVQPYLYSFDNQLFQENFIFENQSAGSYLIRVKDANECEVETTVEITEPAEIQLDSELITDVAPCFGNRSGRVEITVNGGINPYFYQINDGEQQEIGVFTGLWAGNYTVKVIDSNSCLFIRQITVNQPDRIVLEDFSTHNLSCYQAADGEIHLQVSGGVAPFEFSLDGINFNVSPSFSGLNANNYTVYYRDSEQCSNTLALTITEPDELQLRLENQPVSCHNFCDASINMHVTGGTPAYNYLWSAGINTQSATVSGLCAGTYQVVVSDQNQCANTLHFELDNPPQILVDEELTDETCGNACDGSISLQVEGGMPPYLFDWGTWGTQSTLNQLCSGSYFLNFSDSRQCKLQRVYSIEISSEQPDFEIVAEQTELYLGQQTTLTATSGFSFYRWQPTAGLSNPFESITDVSPLETTTYTLEVEDENGCKYTKSITIFVSDLPCNDTNIFTPNAFTPDDNSQGNDIFYVRSEILKQMRLVIFDRWGKEIFVSTDLNTGWNGEFRGEKLPSGVFVYHLTGRCYDGSFFEKKGNISLIR